MIKADNTEEVVVELIRQMFVSFGENPSRDGLLETPTRVFKMYGELLSGYTKDPSSVFKTFEGNGYTGMVTVCNIPFYSLCEHHLIPFFGKAHIGYVPSGRVLGLSKFVRLVDIYARRLQTQENITLQIADTIDRELKPHGVIVSLEAEHLCMSMRGVGRDGCVTKTTEIRGNLKNNHELQNQFYSEVRGN